MRVVGIDLGEHRIGIAVSDSGWVLASAHSTIVRGDDAVADRAALAAAVAEVGARRVVVGLPLNLDGRFGPAARAAAREAAALAEWFEDTGVAVETFDERLTTVSADRALAQAGRSSRDRRPVVDQVAAAVMLQAWLDTHRSTRSSSD
ncbi:MAG: Holliday junction resolvase RuvX [Acidimicrobiales bacterium]